MRQLFQLSRPSTSQTRRWLTLRRAACEVALVVALYTLYKTGRTLIVGQEGVARRHADLIHQFEGVLRFPSEAWIQGLIHSEEVFRLANVYYTTVHFPLIAVFLVWGFLRRPVEEYRWARHLLVIQTGAALIIHMAFPLAPPRMFPQWGFIDTMSVYGPSPYEGASGGVANQFAAMPSLHVGWAVLIAYVVARTAPRPVAVVAALHATLTTVIVVITANHWWLDAIVGVLLLVVAARIVPLRSARTGAGLPASL